MLRIFSLSKRDLTFIKLIVLKIVWISFLFFSLHTPQNLHYFFVIYLPLALLLVVWGLQRKFEEKKIFAHFILYKFFTFASHRVLRQVDKSSVHTEKIVKKPIKSTFLKNENRTSNIFGGDLTVHTIGLSLFSLRMNFFSLCVSVYLNSKALDYVNCCSSLVTFWCLASTFQALI